MAKKAYVWDGSSWISISSAIPEVNTILPSQNGNSGKFLTTNGSVVSWGTVDLTPYATISSPALTGIPTAPTASINTNTTQIATTAFVIGQGYAKLSSPTFTGTVTIPTPVNATDAATKSYVDNNAISLQPFFFIGV